MRKILGCGLLAATLSLGGCTSSTVATGLGGAASGAALGAGIGLLVGGPAAPVTAIAGALIGGAGGTLLGVGAKTAMDQHSTTPPPPTSATSATS